MILRLLGAMLVVCAAAWRCVSYARRLRAMARRMGAWWDLLCYVREQISCFGTPISRILEQGEDKLRAIGGESAAAARQMSELVGCALREELPASCAALIRALGDELGTVWREEQLARLDHYIVTMERESSAFSQSVAGRIRVHSTLCLGAALGVLLLLW